MHFLKRTDFRFQGFGMVQGLGLQGLQFRGLGLGRFREGTGGGYLCVQLVPR